MRTHMPTLVPTRRGTHKIFAGFRRACSANIWPGFAKPRKTRCFTPFWIRRISPGFAGFRRISPGLAGFRRLAPDFAVSRRVSPGVARFRRISPDFAAGFRRVSSDLAGLAFVWYGMGENGVEGARGDASNPHMFKLASITYLRKHLFHL